MSDAPIDPRWPKILSLSVHEFRTPMTVVAGYIRMLLKDRAGPLSDQQRQLLEEAEKSCGRLTRSADRGQRPLQPRRGHRAVQQAGPPTCTTALREAVEQLPPLPDDREVAIDSRLADVAVPIRGGPVRLDAGVLVGDQVAPARAHRRRAAHRASAAAATAGGYEMQIGDADTIAALDAEKAGERELFDEWRGGVGLILPVARRIIEAPRRPHLGRARADASRARGFSLRR